MGTPKLIGPFEPSSFLGNAVSYAAPYAYIRFVFIVDLVEVVLVVVLVDVDVLHGLQKHPLQ